MNRRRIAALAIVILLALVGEGRIPIVNYSGGTEISGGHRHGQTPVAAQALRLQWALDRDDPWP